MRIMSAKLWIRGLLLTLAFLPYQLVGQKNSVPDWENPSVFERNQEETHVFVVPYVSLAQALDDSRDASLYYRSLDGRWKFQWSINPTEAPENFFAPGFDTTNWSEIRVPSNWQMEGFGWPLFRNIAHPFKSDPPRVPHDYNETGSYVRKFNVPEEWAARQVFLLFDGVHSASYVWVNGREVGYNEGGMEPAEYNITSFVKPGENLLAVRVIRYSDGGYLEDQDMWRLSGIFRAVHLFAAPDVHIRDYRVETDLDADRRDATLRVACRIRNYSKADRRGLSVRAQLFDASRRPVLPTPIVVKDLHLAAGASEETLLSGRVKNPAKWSAETPNLYRLTLELLDSAGKVTEVLGSRIGFRKVEVSDGAVLINGVPVKFNGVNSHMQHPKLGHAMDRETIVKDLTLMKQFNVNCVRTSHYPPEPLYLDVADELGMYIVDEVGDECHATEYLSKDPVWREAFLERGRRLVERDKNHPSVVIWSAGNEAGPGPNIAAIIEQGKKLDPTRPAWLYGGNQEPLPFEDIIGPRYPTPEALEKLAKEPKEKDNRPSFMDEYCAATGNSLGHFQEFWDLIHKHRRLTGGAVWDWPSPGITANIIATADLGPYRNDGYLMGRPRLLQGRFGNAVALSGHDDWVEIYRHPSLDLAGSALTLEAWILPRRWNGAGSFITKGNHQFALQQIAADKLEFVIHGSARVSLVSELPKPWEGQWHHVAAVYDGAQLRLFIDGVPAGAQECRGKIRNTPFPINIGKNAELHGQEHAGELCNSLIDEVRVYDQARTEAQVREDMISTGARDAVLYLPFDTAEEQGEFFSLGIGGRSYGLIWPDRVPQPEMWQLKKSPQPVHVQPVDLLTGKVEITNRYHFTNLNTLRLLWSIQGDDRVLQSGETALDLAPGDRRTLTLPLRRPAMQAGTEYRLLLRFLLKEKQSWAPAGHEVSFEQFDLPLEVPPGPPMPIGAPADLRLEDVGSVLRVRYPEGSYTFDRPGGRLVSAVFRGTELLKEGPRANVWRAPLCNETDQWGRRPADQWYGLQLDSLKEAPVSIRAEEQPGEVRVRINSRSAPPEGDTACANEYSYRFFPSGDVVLELEVKPSGTQPRWLPKVGLQMVLPEAFNQFSWYGRGPFETYPDRKTGAKFGLYSGTVQEQYVRYLVPQDYGNKTDVRWALLSNARGLGLLVIPAHPLNISAQHYRTDNLSRAWYPFQLRAGDGLTLNVDAVTTGVGETPINILPAYRALPNPLKFAVRLKPVDTARDKPMELKKQRWPSP